MIKTICEFSEYIKNQEISPSSKEQILKCLESYKEKYKKVKDIKQDEEQNIEPNIERRILKLKSGNKIFIRWNIEDIFKGIDDRAIPTKK